MSANIPNKRKPPTKISTNNSEVEVSTTANVRVKVCIVIICGNNTTSKTTQ